MANDRKAANLWTARVIPVLLLGIFGYATFVLTKEVCGKLSTRIAIRAFKDAADI